MDLTVEYHVHELEDDHLSTYVGGANDAAQAVAIACAMYTSLQAYSTASDRILVVVDSTGATVGFVGRNPVQAGLPDGG